MYDYITFMGAMTLKYLTVIILSMCAGFYAGSPLEVDLCTVEQVDVPALPLDPGLLHDLEPLIMA